MPAKDDRNFSRQLLVLVILDGWGIKDPYNGNAITLARTPNMDKIILEYPATTLNCNNKKSDFFKLSKCETAHKIIGTGKEESLGQPVKNSLSSILAKNNIPVLKITESEKHTQLNHYFNGENPEEFNGEERIIVPSKNVEHFDDNPSLEAIEISKRTIEEINKGGRKVIIINYPNADVLGGTGNLEAIIKAVEIVDDQIGRLEKNILDKDGLLVITSDHGNAEEMIGPRTGSTKPGRTNNPVPWLIVGHEFKERTVGWPDAVGNDLSTVRPIGTLVNILPSLLTLLSIPIPKDIKGNSLFKQ